MRFVDKHTCHIIYIIFFFKRLSKRKSIQSSIFWIANSRVLLLTDHETQGQEQLMSVIVLAADQDGGHRMMTSQTFNCN